MAQQRSKGKNILHAGARVRLLSLHGSQSYEHGVQEAEKFARRYQTAVFLDWSPRKNRWLTWMPTQNPNLETPYYWFGHGYGRVTVQPA